MSGGVDSSVTARLLADKDYDLSAVYMRNWDTRDESGSDRGCEWEKDWEDVQLVCRQVGLPCELIDLSKEYWTSVFEPSLEAWQAGLTPNPDIWCNREVKFGALMDHVVKKNGAQWLATGHYAGVGWIQSGPLRPRPRLVRAVDRDKDQTYFLSSITESSLEKAIFPLHRLRKTEVRELAAQYKLPTAERCESMGICFVGEKRRFEDFLADYILPNPGPIIDLMTGKELGTHQGLWRYTIGQNAKIPGLPVKMFVARKDSKENRVYVVPGSSHPALYSSGVLVRDFHWIWEDEIPRDVDCQQPGLRGRVKIRHRMTDVPCTVRRQSSRELFILFAEPLLAVTPGQVAALYDVDREWCLGSGEIVQSIPVNPVNDTGNWLNKLL
ncbi:tRNA-methyltransferase [Fomitiporia mediterranea MF3/22]|uniref:tRNA-methyltransferase n=1 Tax=Fomitiporia mediterranea (strain MF3/22) TaxID=694068 RepID=UPI000440974C|nr:tRNA-methyltransferase [Fomitiporia mediterranea MF3/22]EJD02272.1 tRNA-methyltransferase [Fomitiporia mediterranea MF3/22]